MSTGWTDTLRIWGRAIHASAGQSARVRVIAGESKIEPALTKVGSVMSSMAVSR